MHIQNRQRNTLVQQKKYKTIAKTSSTASATSASI